jgi:hypothetical protein
VSFKRKIKVSKKNFWFLFCLNASAKSTYITDVLRETQKNIGSSSITLQIAQERERQQGWQVEKSQRPHRVSFHRVAPIYASPLKRPQREVC